MSLWDLKAATAGFNRANSPPDKGGPRHPTAEQHRKMLEGAR